MIWLLSGAIVLSAVGLVWAAVVRSDPRVTAALGLGARDARDKRRSREVLAGAGLVLGASSAAVDPVVAVVATPVLAVAGYRLPQFLKAREATNRRREIDRSVPDLLDVVAVATAAGLSPRLALERAAVRVHGPLADELAAARATVELGGTWRAGLHEAARSSGVSELLRLAMVLDQGQRLGVPVANRLRDLAREVRTERRLRRQERARRAPVTMLFPLVFLILPAFVLAAVVPAVLVAIRGTT
jgi:tight adherence protein C